MTVEIVLLGDVTTYVSGRRVDAGPSKQRCVLAALAMEPNRVVSAAQLAESVWGTDPPRSAKATLASYVSRLRQVVTAEVVGRSGGYLLAIPETAVDLHRFRALCARARGARDESAEELFAEAMTLWRGHVLGGLDSDWATRQRQHLERELFDAVCDHTDLRLRTGRDRGLVTELADRTADHPLDERVSAQYMLALYRAGRVADALAHYRSLRDRLAGQLGTDPGPQTRRLHTRILNADPALDTSWPDAGKPRPPRHFPAPAAVVLSLIAGARGIGRKHGDTGRPDLAPVPRQLSAPPRWFTGRTRELAQMTDVLSGGERTGIAVIWGARGTGKTSLALRWAHRHLEQFPDGQLQICLRGNSDPMSAATALRGFLVALGVSPAAVGEDLDVQASLYRGRLAGRRMLILLDDARDAEQVHPLLPGAPTCKVVVTCRRHLPRLVGEHGAQPIRLDTFGPDESRALLSARLGEDRLRSEPDAVSELLEHCAGLPLALSTVSARVTAQPMSSLGEVVRELRDAPPTTRSGPQANKPTASLNVPHASFGAPVTG